MALKGNNGVFESVASFGTVTSILLDEVMVLLTLLRDELEITFVVI